MCVVLPTGDSDGVGDGVSAILIETAFVLRADRGLLLGILPVLAQVAVESHCGCSLESDIWAAQELDHARAGHCWIGHDLSGWSH